MRLNAITTVLLGAGLAVGAAGAVAQEKATKPAAPAKKKPAAPAMDEKAMMEAPPPARSWRSRAP
jgi:hypothetical protein